MNTQDDGTWQELTPKQMAKPLRDDDDDTLVYRNELLEEVAQVIEQFKIPFAADTVEIGRAHV